MNNLKTLIDISAGIRLPQYEPEIFLCDDLAKHYLNKLCGHYHWYVEGHGNARYAYYYAEYVIRGRWTEAEAVIAKNARWTYMYAKYIIKDRWPEAEPHIATDLCYRDLYNSIFGTSI
jgi:hypothetical protein